MVYKDLIEIILDIKQCGNPLLYYVVHLLLPNEKYFSLIQILCYWELDRC